MYTSSYCKRTSEIRENKRGKTSFQCYTYKNQSLVCPNIWIRLSILEAKPTPPPPPPPPLLKSCLRPCVKARETANLVLPFVLMMKNILLLNSSQLCRRCTKSVSYSVQKFLSTNRSGLGHSTVQLVKKADLYVCLVVHIRMLSCSRLCVISTDHSFKINQSIHKPEGISES